MQYETWRRAMSGWARSRGCNVALFDSVSSTNDVGTSFFGRQTAPSAGCWVFALEQSSGRGRYGRQWVSPHGAGVYASYLFDVPSAVVPVLPQLVGVALCEGLEVSGFRCRLKWPNDLLLDGKKLGGILLQARATGGRTRAVAGFGINRGHRSSELPREDATSLIAEGDEVPSVQELTCGLAERVEDEVSNLLRGPREAQQSLVDRYGELSAHRPGDHLAVTVGDGVLHGEFDGFSAAGELRLTSEGTVRFLSAGEVES